MSKRRIGVLLGGKSAEREVSLDTGSAIARALRKRGYDVVEIDAQDDVDVQIRAAGIDAAFLALHGRYGEDGTIQGMLEMMGIPYNGSSVLSSAVVMDKVVSAALLSHAGLPVARSYLVGSSTELDFREGWAPPVVVKPADEGSSFGITIVKSEAEFGSAIKAALAHSARVMVEEFIPGPEVTVAVLNGRVLGSLEVEPHAEYYDYSAKYDDGGSTHHIPPRISDEINEQVLALGRDAYHTLLCAGAARVDFIIRDGKEPVILEVNTLPGMTDKSLLPEIAESVGISFEDLVVEIVENVSLHV